MRTESILFTPVTVGELQLPNRFAMAPMTRSRADAAGVPCELAALYYAQRASAGLIISEGTAPSPMGRGYLGTPGIHASEQVNAWRLVTDAVHAAGGHIFLQLMHAGRISHPSLLPGEATPVAPSGVRPEGSAYTASGLESYVTPRALDADEIPGVIAEYSYAARRAMDAGFDGVELHAASGYLPMQFLSSGTNRRSDAYGGSAPRRVRFVVETLEAIAGAIGADRVGIKISPELAFNDIVDEKPRETYGTLVRAIGHLSLAYLHVALSGTPVDYHAMLRSMFKGAYLAGGGLDEARAETMLTKAGVDMAVFGALFLANPDLPARLRAGRALNEPDRETYYGGGAEGYTDYPALADAT